MSQVSRCTSENTDILFCIFLGHIIQSLVYFPLHTHVFSTTYTCTTSAPSYTCTNIFFLFECSSPSIKNVIPKVNHTSGYLEQFIIHNKIGMPCTCACDLCTLAMVLTHANRYNAVMLKRHIEG